MSTDRGFADSSGWKSDLQLCSRLLAFTWPYRFHLSGAFIAIMVGSVLQLSQPWFTKLAIDNYIANHDIEGLWSVAAAIAAVLAASFCTEVARITLTQITAHRIMHDLRLCLFNRLQCVSLSYYHRNPIGQIVTCVTTDVDALNDFFSVGVVALTTDVIMLGGMIVMLFVLDVRLAMIIVVLLPVVLFIIRWFRRNARIAYGQVRLCVGELSSWLQESIVGLPTIRLCQCEVARLAQFSIINHRHLDANLASTFYYAAFYPLLEFTGAIATGLIIVVGGSLVTEHSLTLGTLVACLQYSQRFFRPLGDVSEKFNLIQSTVIASRRIVSLLDAPTMPTASRRSPVALPVTSRGHIVFDSVSFAYSGDDFVLRDVSFEIKPGEHVGIVGPSGAGKSTALSLMMRFYDVNRGRVLLDGVDVREFDVSELRKCFGVVLQDNYLFTGSISSNVRLGFEAIDDEAVLAAIQAVRFDRHANAIYQGITTPISERGIGLSVGQKQLLSCARALAFQRPILLLDEATSSVDTETESLIQDALRLIMVGRTTLAVAHRLSTLRQMDRILVFNHGRIVETGTHEQLLASSGLYRVLHECQYRPALATRSSHSPSAA